MKALKGTQNALPLQVIRLQSELDIAISQWQNASSSKTNGTAAGGGALAPQQQPLSRVLPSMRRRSKQPLPPQPDAASVVRLAEVAVTELDAAPQQSRRDQEAAFAEADELCERMRQAEFRLSRCQVLRSPHNAFRMVADAPVWHAKALSSQVSSYLSFSASPIDKP